MTLYQPAVRNMIKQFTAEIPHGLIVSIEEIDSDAGRYLQLVLWRGNFDTFLGDEKLLIANKLDVLFKMVNDSGIPMFLEVREGSGR